MRRISFNIGLLAIILLILFSCIKNELDFGNIKTSKWNSEWAVPLISSQLTLTDFLTDTTGIIQEDADGFITLVYEAEELTAKTVEDVAEIPDQLKVLNKSFSIDPFFDSLPPGQPIPPIPLVFPVTFELSEPGLRLDSTTLKEGIYKFRLKTNLNRDNADVNVSIPNIVHHITYEPIQFTVDIDNPDGNELVFDTLINLEAYTLHFEHSFDTANVVYINTVFVGETDDNPNNSPYFVELENRFEDLDFVDLFGYVGYHEKELQDTIVLNIFSINEGGHFEFGPGSVRFDVTSFNSLGMPITLDIRKCRAFHGGSEPDSVDIHIFGEGNPSEVEIDFPGLNQVGETVITEVNTEEANINEALEISPDKLVLDVLAKLNPDADSTVSNFVLDSSELRAEVKIELDLFGAVHGFKVADTLEFNLENTNEINALLFVIDIENGFPLNAKVQLDFIDSVNNIVHSLLPPDEQLMDAAPVSSPPEYKVIEPTKKLTQVVINTDNLEKVFNAKKMVFVATLSTSDGLVKIYSDYNIGLKLGAKAEISY